MVNIAAVIRTDREKEGGIFNISIRVTQKGVRSYYSTNRFANRTQHLTKKLAFKDPQLIAANALEVAGLHGKLKLLGAKVDSLSAKEIADYLKDDNANTPVIIDFIAETILHAKTKNKANTAVTFFIMIKAFKDHTRREVFDVKELNSTVLQKFEDYLRTNRLQTRPDIKKRPVTLMKEPIGNTTLHNYMTCIRTVFNWLKKKYNGEFDDEIVIRHDPFSKYKIPKRDNNKSNKRNIKPATLIQIRDFSNTKYGVENRTNRAEMARDVLMLSYYLVGMNSVDLYQVVSYENGRINYNRSKTESRRKDEAFISIKVEPEAIPIINKYRDPSGERVFIFHKNYVSANGFNKSINLGLKKLLKLMSLEIELTFYYGRHSWATIARNICKVSKEDIGESLNHASSHDVTDIYIERDWSIIDDANRKVLDILLKPEEPALQLEYEIHEDDLMD